MMKCISRYTKLTKPLVQIQQFQRHYAKQSDFLSAESVQGISHKMKSELIKRLKRLNEQHEQHTQLSANSWLDVFYRDNSADQQERIDLIKDVFHLLSSPSVVEKLGNSPTSSVLLELDKLEDHYFETMFKLKDENLGLAATVRYKEILVQLNKYGNLDLKEKDGVVDSSQFSLFNAKFITILNNIQFGENGEVAGQDSKISELVQSYLELPVPRPMDLNHDQIAKFAAVVTEGFTFQECFQVSGSILKDIQESSKPITYEEYGRWIEKLYTAAKANTNRLGHAIESVKDVSKQWKEDLDMVLHNRALSFCLKNQDYDEFEVQLKNLQSSQILPNRETLTLMMKYATKTKNINSLLNVLLDFVIKRDTCVTYSFYPNEYAVLFKSLIQLKQKDLAFFILNELSEIRENYRKMVETEDGPEMLRLLDEDHSTIEEQGVKATSYAYDYIMKNQTIVDCCPIFTVEMLAPFFDSIETVDEFDQLKRVISQMSGGTAKDQLWIS
ncbi:unnamed protein product [Ambrosiozyma monospora]|uniref:Unnamed protein product n=1 Tax=Ambrosiozyma monospora TaxID=43982 RepID=A0ACB5TAI7_AMBMO|nr:unnamed protein product [Ambrosiozyma monospora]